MILAQPPVGVYQVGEPSPDGDYACLRTWLTERDINFAEVYRVHMFSLGAWVFRFKRNKQGNFYTRSTLDDSVARRLPYWVWP